MKTLGIIPSRYGSSRFPGKPLADLAGKPIRLEFSLSDAELFALRLR